MAGFYILVAEIRIRVMRSLMRRVIQPRTYAQKSEDATFAFSLPVARPSR